MYRVLCRMILSCVQSFQQGCEQPVKSDLLDAAPEKAGSECPIWSSIVVSLSCNLLCLGAETWTYALKLHHHIDSLHSTSINAQSMKVFSVHCSVYCL